MPGGIAVLAMNVASDHVQTGTRNEPEASGLVFRQTMDERIEVLRRLRTSPDERKTVKQSIGRGEPEAAIACHGRVPIIARGDLVILNPLARVFVHPKQ